MILFLFLVTSYAVISNECTQATDPTSSKFDSENVVDGTASFTIKLGRALADEFKEENFLFSPVNLLNALAILHLGSNGVTRDQLAKILGFPKDEIGASEAQNFFADSLRQLRSSNTTKVELASALFVQQTISLNQSYVQEALSRYDSEVLKMELDDPTTTAHVNNWIATKTHNRIPKLFSGPLPNAKFIIIAALYFSGNWTHPFEPSNTMKGQFKTISGILDVHMMTDTQVVPYYESPSAEFHAISLSYEHEDYAMYIILPNESQSLSHLIRNLQPEQLHEIVDTSAKRPTLVEYKIPRTKYTLNHVMNQDLSEIGLAELFHGADFGRIHNSSYGEPLLDIQHAVEIEIDEAGTVGSAVTAISWKMVAPEPEIRAGTTFYVDRPFAFYIYHRSTKSIIFFGHVYRPVP